MRLRFRQALAVSTTTAEEKDLGNSESDVIVDSLTEGGAMRFKVVAGATNQNLQHPQVATAAYLYLKAVSKDPLQAPVELTLKRNSTAGEAWPLTPIDGKEAILQMGTSGLTALYVSNPGAVDMLVTVGMAGD